VDPHFSAMLYAGDRFEAKSRIVTSLERGANRACGSLCCFEPGASNGARARGEAGGFPSLWIEHLEYGIYDLPREDLVLYLRVPPQEAQSLVKKKSSRSYNGLDTRHPRI